MKKQFLIVTILIVITSGMVFSLDGVLGEPGISVQRVSASAQRESTLDWTQRFPENFPEPRHAHAMAYDSARGVTVLFGGLSWGWVDDTWEWDGTNWTQIFPTNNPSRRLGHAMAYDSEREVTVLFGGYGEGQTYNDTWEWDGTNWNQRSPSHSPPARLRHAMAYDADNKVTILFGGFISGADYHSYEDTWEWNGEDWEQKLTVTNPFSSSPNPNAGMAYDSAREVVVLLTNHSSTPLWEWDGIDWVRRAPANKPESRYSVALAFDSARGSTVLFGGSSTLNDTWDWDGIAWTRHIPANKPLARAGHGMAYDSNREVVVLFGGILEVDDITYHFFDTWEYGAVSEPDPEPTPDPNGQKIFLPLILH